MGKVIKLNNKTYHRLDSIKDRFFEITTKAYALGEMQKNDYTYLIELIIKLDFYSIYNEFYFVQELTKITNKKRTLI